MHRVWRLPYFDKNQSKRVCMRKRILARRKTRMERLSIADLITENESFFNAIVKAGIVDPCWQTRLEIYREFRELSDDLPVMRRYYIIANRRKISDATVRKAVSFFVGN